MHRVPTVSHQTFQDQFLFSFLSCVVKALQGKQVENDISCKGGYLAWRQSIRRSVLCMFSLKHRREHLSQGVRINSLSCILFLLHLPTCLLSECQRVMPSTQATCKILICSRLLLSGLDSFFFDSNYKLLQTSADSGPISSSHQECITLSFCMTQHKEKKTPRK